MLTKGFFSHCEICLDITLKVQSCLFTSWYFLTMHNFLILHLPLTVIKGRVDVSLAKQKPRKEIPMMIAYML